MKVLKPGRPQKEWAKEYKCTGAGNKDGGCGAKLLVEKSDLFYTYASYMGRDEAWFVTFECPQCKVLTDVDAPFAPTSLPHYQDWKENSGKDQSST